MKEGTIIRASRGGALIWLVITGAFGLLAAALLILTYFQNRTIETLGAEVAHLQGRLLEERKARSPADDSTESWPLFGPGRPITEEWLRKKGLSDPAKDLVADLRAHPELIPYEGIFGGTMGFYDGGRIHPLDPRYVIARFDDGHIDGTMLLKYEVEDGEIRWTVLDSYLNE